MRARISTIRNTYSNNEQIDLDGPHHGPWDECGRDPLLAANRLRGLRKRYAEAFIAPQRRSLDLAPAVKELLDPSVGYLWAVAEDSKGNFYTGGGSTTGTLARLYKIDPAGKSETIAELEGLEIHAIAIDSKDAVYAATAPDGKVTESAVAASPKFSSIPEPNTFGRWYSAPRATSSSEPATKARFGEFPRTVKAARSSSRRTNRTLVPWPSTRKEI